MARITLELFAADVAQGLERRLVALLLYGSLARAGPETGTGKGATADTLLLVDAVDADLFARLAPSVRRWTAAGHAPPLILTQAEWHAAADAFPIEYEDIREAHRLLAGRDPWEGIAVRAEHVRRQLEHELMGKLVHLRQAYAAFWGDRRRLAAVIAGTVAGFFTMLRAVLRLAGTRQAGALDRAAVLHQAAALVGFSADGLRRLADGSGSRPLTLAAGDALPAAYLEAVARTAAHVNRLERTSP